jgi:hypothetical protein
MRLYSIFGINILTNMKFRTNLLRVKGDHHLAIIKHNSIQQQKERNQEKPIYSSISLGLDGQNVLLLYQIGQIFVLRFPGVAEYHLEEKRISIFPFHDGDEVMIETYLLSTILSFWFELHQSLMLHSSSVVINNKAVLFLSNSGGGKSTLTASFLQTGCQMLSDDIVPLKVTDGRVVANPGFPSMRMWAKDVKTFDYDNGCLTQVHPKIAKYLIPVGEEGYGHFCSEPRAVRIIYVIDRSDFGDKDARISISPISPRDSVLEMLRHSFTPNIVEVVGLTAQRLKTISQLVQSVPVRKLVYPSGDEFLLDVKKAILTDLGITIV